MRPARVPKSLGSGQINNRKIPVSRSLKGQTWKNGKTLKRTEVGKAATQLMAVTNSVFSASDLLIEVRSKISARALETYRLARARRECGQAFFKLVYRERLIQSPTASAIPNAVKGFRRVEFAVASSAASGAGK